MGSSDEKRGNQIAQYDGNQIIFRVPYALEKKYGKYLHAPLKFEYEKGQKWIIDAIANNRALTYRIYAELTFHHLDSRKQTLSHPPRTPIQ